MRRRLRGRRLRARGENGAQRAQALELLLLGTQPLLLRVELATQREVEPILRGDLAALALRVDARRDELLLERDGTRLPCNAVKRCSKCRARGSMSSTRSRKGGTRIG